MLPPLPRCSGWAYSSLISPSRVSLPRKGHRVGLHIVLFEACSAFTRVAACTLARSPYFVTPLSEGFRHFVTSMPAPVASGWSGRRVGLAPTGKAPPFTAHVESDREPRRPGRPGGGAGKGPRSRGHRSETVPHPAPTLGVEKAPKRSGRGRSAGQGRGTAHRYRKREARRGARRAPNRHRPERAREAGLVGTAW